MNNKNYLSMQTNSISIQCDNMDDDFDYSTYSDGFNDNKLLIKKSILKKSL